MSLILALKAVVVVWIIIGLVGLVIRLRIKRARPRWYFYPIIIPLHLILGFISLLYGLNCVSSNRIERRISG